MKNTADNQNEFIYIHVRPGKNEKMHPIGTIAIDVKNGFYTYNAGWAMLNSDSDSWDASRGRMIAAGRATSTNRIEFKSSGRHRELILDAAKAILQANHYNNGRPLIVMNKRFKKALKDTIARIEKNVIHGNPVHASAAQ